MAAIDRNRSTPFQDKDEKLIESAKEYSVEVGRQAHDYKTNVFTDYVKGGATAAWLEWLKPLNEEYGDSWKHIKKITQDKVNKLKVAESSPEFAYAIHYRLHADFKRPSYAKDIDSAVFAQPACIEFDRPVFEETPDFPKPDKRRPQPLDTVHLGEFKVSLRPKDGLFPLSVQDNISRELIADGKPNVFAALHWQTNLTSLHGRLDEYNRLYNWAWKDKTTKVKVMLLSGPGGVGKSRLAAQVVSVLIDEHDWKGGFPLRYMPGKNIEYDGVGEGVALIIDYPEENTEQVKNVLRAAASIADYEKPIRLILTSRENLESWKYLLNEYDLSWLEEIPLANKSYLDDADALNLAYDVSDEYAEQIGYEKKSFSGVKEWLNRNASHRIPLNVLAASVHAVIDPQNAFELGSKEVLTALAKIELKRVRSYSSRDFKTRNNDKNELVLEKLLSLAVISGRGLTEKVLHKLGALEIASGLSPQELVDACYSTPFWHHSKSTPTANHLCKIEPDIVAVAFMSLVFFENQRPLRFHQYIATVIDQAGGDFIRIYGRLIYDMILFNPDNVEILRAVVSEVLNQFPDLIQSLTPSITSKPNPFNAAIYVHILKNIINMEDDPKMLAPLLNNLSAAQLISNNENDAVESMANSVAQYEHLYKINPEKYHSYLASAKGHLAVITLKSGDAVNALFHAEEAAEIFNLKEKSEVQISPMLVEFLINYASILNSNGRYNDAVFHASVAIDIAVKLDDSACRDYKGLVALALLSFCRLLPPNSASDQKIEMAGIAAKMFLELSKQNPDVYMHRVAETSQILALELARNKKFSEANSVAESILHIYKRMLLIESSHSVCEFANFCGEMSNIFSKYGKYEDALDLTGYAESFFREIVESAPHEDSYKLGLAKSLDTLARLSLLKGTTDEFEKFNSEAVEIFQAGYISNKQLFFWDYSISLANRALHLIELGESEKGKNYALLSLEIIEQNADGQYFEDIGNIANTLELLGGIFIKCDECYKSVYLYKKAVKLRKKALVPNALSMEYVFALHNLSTAYLLIGKMDNAVNSAKDAVQFLSPYFFANMDELAQSIGLVTHGYLVACERAGLDPEQNLVRPILNVVRLQQADQ